MCSAAAPVVPVLPVVTVLPCLAMQRPWCLRCGLWAARLQGWLAGSSWLPGGGGVHCRAGLWSTIAHGCAPHCVQHTGASLTQRPAACSSVSLC
jgi:hypothetical protein